MFDSTNQFCSCLSSIILAQLYLAYFVLCFCNTMFQGVRAIIRWITFTVCSSESTAVPDSRPVVAVVVAMEIVFAFLAYLFA